MRSTIDIREDLLEEAMRLTKAKTKKEVVNLSLEELIRRKRIEELIAWIGSGDINLSREELDRMREDDLKQIESQYE
ncbi:type II toxin-antitoxin system VapB family antitoxin [candidate division TA06 bacterium]|nr:type II toxin-antitoxin system VapB family antitoxin [candidate division TA06 bacterium]